MPKIWTHRKPCRLCNSRKVTPALKYTFTPPDTCFIGPDGAAEITEKIPLILSLCEKCSLVQMQDVVDPERLFRKNLNLGFPGPELDAHWEEFAQDAITRGHLKKGDLVVDIGCGDGSLLRVFQRMGMKVVGVDPAAAAKELSNKHGIPHYGDLFSPSMAHDIRKEHGAAALITANYTLGAIDNLHAVASGVRFLLAHDGLFVFEEPYLADMLSQNQFDLVHHERLSLLTATPLEPFFRTVFLHLIDAKRNPFRHGSIRYVAQRNDGPHVVSPNLSNLLGEEQQAKLHSMDTLNAFVARVEELKAAIKTIADEHRNQGKRIAGYGASGRTVTFIHECGWDHTHLEYIVDDFPPKKGLKLPGTDIPVVAAKTLSERRPDLVILFAYNDADRIVKQHEAYRKSGGKFLLPFPKPKFI